MTVSGHGRRDPRTGCTERVEVRCTADFRWRLEQAAADADVTPAAFVRLAVLRAMTALDNGDDFETDEEAAEEAMHASPVPGSMPVGRLHGPRETERGWLARLHPAVSDDEAREALEAVHGGARVTVVRSPSVVLAWTSSA